MRPSTAGAADGGIGLSPYVFGTAETSFPLSDSLSLVLSGSAALEGGIALLIRAGQDPKFLTGPIDGGPGTSGSLSGAFTMALRNADAAGGRQTLFSVPSVVFDAAAVTAGLGITADLDPSILFKLEDGRIHIASDGADGFLGSILPDEGITTTVDLEASWSHRDGLNIKGGAGLSTVLDLHKRAGPLRVDSLALALKGGPQGLTGTVGVSGGVSIGPVTASVADVGAEVALKFSRGNLGPVDLAARFMPPKGIGLSVDARGLVTGAGFLFRDEARSLYAGAMQLSIRDDITLKAFGLIATRMPDGRRGYSLIVFITAEDFRPIPLPLGFRLLGIGGMVGVNRTFDRETLRQGLENGTLATLLFPRDPVGNATRSFAISTARSRAAGQLPARHPRQDRLAHAAADPDGPGADRRVRIAHATARARPHHRAAAIAGQRSRAPQPGGDGGHRFRQWHGRDRCRARGLAAGAEVPDHRKGRASRRIRRRPSFILSVGGFNPRFAPPANCPAIDRVAIALSSGNNPRLICEAYFAITSNTVQFGARAELYASAGGFSVEGAVGFDVLVQLIPLHFIADFQAKLQLKRGSHNLFRVKLKGSLEGPRPLRVSGKATFEILWCDFSVRFDTTLVKGSGRRCRPRSTCSRSSRRRSCRRRAGPRSAARHRATAWRCAACRAAAGAAIVLDPLGRLRVSQLVVPLNTARDIDSSAVRRSPARAGSPSPRNSVRTPLPRTVAQGGVRAGAVLRDER